MRSLTLQSQPSRPPPPFDPIVEAWLDSIPQPTVKPSIRELRQWRLSNYHGLGRSVFVTCLILRAVSLAVALAVTGIISSVMAKRQGPTFILQKLVPIIVVCPMVVLWDTAEFVTATLNVDKGISPNIHAIVDGVLFLGIAIATGILLADVICGITDLGSRFDSASKEITSACLLIILMVIHSFLLFFYICNYVENTKRKPRARHRNLQRRHNAPHAFADNLWPDPRQETPLEPPKALKLAQITTSLELKSIDPRPSHEPPEFHSSWHQNATGGWLRVEPNWPLPAKPLRYYERTAGGEADQNASELRIEMGRYM
ncbi:hypothetical protein VTI74DRAFT_4558 [Chaetomium olivicolor]